MINLARNSKFNININFKKSHGSHLYDNRTKREYLDFFGMYASLPLGYNHEVFKESLYVEQMKEACHLKINNCEFVSDETLEFDKIFSSFCNKANYVNFHYTCTGALAVESAIKTCIHHTDYREPLVLSFTNSFHGINSYGGFITDRFKPADKKLSGFPEPFSLKIPASELDNFSLYSDVKPTCVVVEPIQCSAGDIHHSLEFFKKLRKFCDNLEVPLIFDEIQTGFGGTGKLWYYEWLGITPDIVIYGKKTQLSGIMVNEKYSKIFINGESTRLEVTWDADLLDMIRCKQIIKAYKKFNVLENVEKMGSFLLSSLSELPYLQNTRGKGLIIAFDLKTASERDLFVDQVYKNGMIVNKTGSKSIRIRPNLCLTKQEAKKAISILNKSLQEIYE
jgi:L-lysine 6-transaminase